MEEPVILLALIDQRAHEIGAEERRKRPVGYSSNLSREQLEPPGFALVRNSRRE